MEYCRVVIVGCLLRLLDVFWSFFYMVFFFGMYSFSLGENFLVYVIVI